MSSPSTDYSWQEQLLDQLVGNANVLLSAHAPNYGPSWQLYSGAVPKLDGNRRFWVPLDVSGGGAGALVAGTGVLATANQMISAQITLLDPNDDVNYGGVMLRTADPDVEQTGYGLYYSAVDQLWILSKWVAGAQTVLATYDLPMVPGQTIGVTLAVIGGTLYPLLAGTPQPTIADGAIAGPGRAGVMLGAGYNPTILQGCHAGAVVIGYRP